MMEKAMGMKTKNLKTTMVRIRRRTARKAKAKVQKMQQTTKAKYKTAKMSSTMQLDRDK
jgi:putative lipoic acid-binding regulatory protein